MDVNSFSFLEQYFINFGDVEMKILNWLANSIEPGQTARMYRLAWLYTGGSLNSVPAR
jgi:hypothetical protein